MDKPISIIILSNDDSIGLKAALEALLAQTYEPGFEVIVVRETRRGEVRDILKPMMEEYKNLRSTYLPDKPQYVSDDEIKILLGVKAAQNDSLLIIPPAYTPDSDSWLATLAGNLELTEDTPILFGDAHIKGQLGFFSRRRHSKALNKKLKPWCKEKGLKRKTLTLNKAIRHDISIFFSKNDYLADMTLRDIISLHVIV